MTNPSHFLIEGLDRLGKDTLSRGIQDRLGFHQVLHYSKPIQLACYASDFPPFAARQYQEARFRTMLQLLRGAP